MGNSYNRLQFKNIFFYYITLHCYFTGGWGVLRTTNDSSILQMYLNVLFRYSFSHFPILLAGKDEGLTQIMELMKQFNFTK